MPDRRYTDEEVASIFERATQGSAAPARQLPAEHGLTLSDLQDIGRQTGIAPDAIASAARALDRSAPVEIRRQLGMPIGVQRTAALGRKLTTDEWEQLVVRLRETFHARGVVQSEGNFRQWSNGNLHALIEPTPAGERLRLSTYNGNARTWLAGGVAMLGIASAVAIAGAIGGNLGQELRAIMLIGTIGAGLLLSQAIRLPSWARLRAKQMDGIAESVGALTEGDQQP